MSKKTKLRIKSSELRNYFLLLTSHFSLKNGYTLAELLAVLSIFVIITGIVTAIIYSTLRGSSKTKITTEVSQNGQYATSVIAGIIADSRNVLAVNGTTFDDCTTLKDSSVIPTPAPPAAPQSITLKRMDGGVTILSCQGSGNDTIIASNGASLINNNAVKASACKFTCSQVSLLPGSPVDPYDIPIIGVSFNLSEKNAALFESKSQSSFNTTTSLRVYSP